MKKLLLIGLASLIGLWVIGSMTAPAAPETAREHSRYDAQWAAIEACREQAIRNTPYPSKAEFHPAVNAFSDDGINWSIIGTVDLMNEYGALIPHRYACIVQGSTVVSGSLRG